MEKKEIFHEKTCVQATLLVEEPRSLERRRKKTLRKAGRRKLGIQAVQEKSDLRFVQLLQVRCTNRQR